MKKAYIIAACIAACFVLTTLAFSQTPQHQTLQMLANDKLIHGAPTTCPNDPVLPSDGTPSAIDFSFGSTSSYYTLNAKKGHSYSVDIWDTFDPTIMISPTITITSDCMKSISGVFDVTMVDPDLSGGFSDRVSWIQTSDQTVFIKVTNPDPNQNDSYTYNIKVTDTSLHNIHWSTFSPFYTQWTLTNLTANDISGTFTVVGDDGTTLATFSLTLPAGRFTLLDSRAKGVPANKQGAATLTYVGPAGAIRGDTVIVRNDSAVIIQSSFVPQHSSF